MTGHTRKPGFTLIALLVVVSIIALLVSVMLPSLSTAKELARITQCQSCTHNLGISAMMYLDESEGLFWPYVLNNHPVDAARCYWWGTDADPVDAPASPFMQQCEGQLPQLWCPSFKWGSYIPQGWYVSEPTTTYGYNAYYLDPTLDGTSSRNIENIPEPAKLFVFNDSAMRWRVAGKWIFQNSTYLEPVTGSWVQTPTSHFRHLGRTNALCADGHTQLYDTEGWSLDTSYNLGFVGTENYPHYVQP